MAAGQSGSGKSSTITKRRQHYEISNNSNIVCIVWSMDRPPSIISHAKSNSGGMMKKIDKYDEMVYCLERAVWRIKNPIEGNNLANELAIEYIEEVLFQLHDEIKELERC